VGLKNNVRFKTLTVSDRFSTRDEKEKQTLNISHRSSISQSKNTFSDRQSDRRRHEQDQTDFKEDALPFYNAGEMSSNSLQQDSYQQMRKDQLYTQTAVIKMLPK